MSYQDTHNSLTGFYGELIGNSWKEARKRLGENKTEQPKHAKYKNKPNEFLREVVGFNPWTAKDAKASGRSGKMGQDEWGDALLKDRSVSIVANNGSGKTNYAAGLVLWFMCTRPNARVVTLGPTWTQVTDFLWRYLRAMHAQSRLKLPGTPMTYKWDLGPVWVAQGFSTDSEEQAQGFHTFTSLDHVANEEGEMLVIGDEAGGLQQYIFDAMHGWSTKGNCYTMLIGNANEAEGGFYNSHQDGSLYTRFQCSAFDCPSWLVNDRWIDDRRVDPGEGTPLWQVRVEGQFTEAGGQYEWFPAWLRKKAMDGAPLTTGHGGDVELHMGVDIADTGRDRCVASLLKGNQLVAQEAWNTDELMESANNVVALAESWGISRQEANHIHIDSIGVGSGVCSRLRQMNWGIDPVHWGGKVLFDYPEYVTEETKLKNRKAELHYVARRLMIDGRLSVPAKFSLTLRQLGWLRWKLYQHTEVTICEPKDQLTKRVGASPDYAESVLYALSRSSSLISIHVL